MSRSVATLVYSRRIGTMARKAVLAYCADRANDDGTGVWASKQRIADEIECSRQTVISVMRGLVADGLLIENGKRKCTNGFTTEYAVAIEAVAMLPSAKHDDDAPVQILTGQKLGPSTGFTPSRQPALHEPSMNRPKVDQTMSAQPKRRGKPAPVLPDGVSAEQWASFIEMRRRIGAALTETAKSLVLGKLARLADDGQPPGEILDQSTMNGWRGIFPLKDQDLGNRHDRTRGNGGGNDRPWSGRRPVGSLTDAALGRLDLYGPD